MGIVCNVLCALSAFLEMVLLRAVRRMCSAPALTSTSKQTVREGVEKMLTSPATFFRGKVFLEQGKPRTTFHLVPPDADHVPVLQRLLLDYAVEEAFHRGNHQRPLRVAPVEHDP